MVEIFHYDYENINGKTISLDDYKNSIAYLFNRTENSIYMLVLFNGKRYFLGKVKFDENIIESIYTLNFILKIKGIQPIKNLGYHLLKWKIINTFDKKVLIKDILIGADGFYKKAISRLIDEGIIKKVEYIDFSRTHIKYDKIILYK